MIDILRSRLTRRSRRKHLAAPLGGVFLFIAGSLLATSSFAASKEAKIEPPGKYAESGTITYCANFTNPPREFYIQGEPAGADVDLALAMAGLLGLEVDWLQIKFAGLIPALLAGQCDMIVGELFIKPKRKEVIDFVPFSVSAEQIVVRQGEGENIQGLDDLAGKKVGVPNGTTFLQLIQEENSRRKAAGKTPIRLLIVPGTREMFHQLMIGMVDAAGSTTTSSAYYIQKTDGKLVRAGEPFHRITDGFGVRQDEDGLRKAMEKALHRLMESGRYEKIFARYDLKSAMLDQ